MRRFGIQFLLLMFFLLTPCLSTGSAATAEMMPELSATGFTAAPDANEKAWLEAHPVLRVGGPKAFPPFHFFDDAGNPQGMASDYLQIYHDLLGVLVRHTDSVFGFLDEVLYEPDGAPYKLNLALSNIAWDDDSRDLYDQLVARRLEFRNLNNLAGAPVLEKKTIVTNNPARHSRYQGMPKGHPPITSYMGIPVVFRDRIIGVAGVANRSGGYSDDIAASVNPLINACAAMIWGERILQRDRENRAALQSSRETFRLVADFTYDWEYWIAPDGSLPYVSPSCERITGYRPEAFQNDPGLMMRIIHPDDASPITDHLFVEYRLSELGICRMDFRIINRSGEERWISHVCQPVLGTDGQYLGRRASNRDISRRKRAEQELLEIRDHFEMVFNMNPDGAQITRLTDGCVVNINEGVTAMTGYAREDMIGKRTLDIDLWENPDDRQPVLDALKENGFCENYEAVFRRKDGTRFVGMMSSRRYLYRAFPMRLRLPGTFPTASKQRSSPAICRRPKVWAAWPGPLPTISTTISRRSWAIWSWLWRICPKKWLPAKA